MTPEQYGDLREAIGRIETGVSNLNGRADKTEAEVKAHTHRISSLENSRKWAAGVLAGVAVIAKLFKVV